MARPTSARLAAVLVVFVVLVSSLAVVAAAPRALAGPSHAASASPLALTARSGPEGPKPASSYIVSFAEMGLPSGLTFQVTLSNHDTSATTTDGGTDTIGFFLGPGSYNYAVAGNRGWHQTTIPYVGSFTVTNAGIAEPTMVYSQVNYTTTFSESGLPSGQMFQVTFNGTTSSLTTDGGTDSLAFMSPNGTQLYQIADISGWHQTTLPYHGHVVVNGANINEPTLAYVQVTYSVTFPESGLPSGQTYQVTVGGDTKSLTTNGAVDSLSWSGFINDTYAYSITDISGWHQSTLPYNGNVVVNGASVSEPTLAFTKTLYSVLFFEDGLAPGQTFQVTVGATTESITSDGGTDSILFTEANGTYSYSIAGISGWHQTTLPHTGSLMVTGASVEEPTLEYIQVTYTLTFTESGLPTGTNWSITIGADTENSTTPSIAFTEPNGSYSYRVDYVAGYVPNSPTGSKTVTGGDASVSVPFTQVLYAVTFTETGLPGGTSWSVTINTHSVSSTSTTVVFHLANGSYSYTIDYVSGWVPTQPTGSVGVTGAPAGVSVMFTQVRYSVTFTESGLPTGPHPKSWSVALDGVQQSSTGTSIVFSVGNGSQSYLVKGPSGYRVSSVLPPSGSIVVNGGSVSQAVTFLRGGTPSLAFHEVGLGAGTHWCVVLGSTLCSTTDKIVSHNMTPGTYAYSIGAVTGLTTLAKYHGGSVAPSGSVALSSASTIQVRYSYAVTFTESGLPGSTPWQVNAGGQTVPSTGTTIVLYLVNGTYTFHVGKVTGFTASPGSGAIRVMGAPLSVSVRFTVAPHH
jgi:hypothetical protein